MQRPFSRDWRRRWYSRIVPPSATPPPSPPPRALDAASRTLQVELQIDNAAGELLPGSYAQVHFTLSAGADTLRVPVNTVLFRAHGLEVATLDNEHRVHLKSITQGRDFGTEIEVLTGIDAADTLVVNPPDSISEGAPVRIVQPRPSPRDAAGP